tara:strand:+ start:59 stop:931 length:873 start_codon:yes stop_codon:yes gene_type:complete
MKMVLILSFICVTLIFIFNNTKSQKDISIDNDKIISIGGSITETLFKLGLGDLVIAVDQSSTMPPSVNSLPQIGYIRRISSEGVLAMMPTTIITTSEIGPEIAINEIKSSGIDFKIYDAPKDLDGLKKNINEISKFFKVNDKAKKIISDIDNKKEMIDSKVLENNKTFKMIFIMNPSNASYTVAGSNTVANYLIELIGGENIFSNDFSNYRTINKEEFIKKNPDVLLISTHYDSLDAINHFIKNSDYKNLKPIINNNVISMPLSHLSMGPSFIINAYNILKNINVDDSNI